MAMPKPEMPPILSAPGLLANQIVCYPSSMVTTNNFWHGQVDPLAYSLPLILIQLLVVLLTTRLLVFILRPQPRILCEFIAGIILGPTILGQIGWFSNKLFLKESLLRLEIIANIGVVYFAFMIGLGTDFKGLLQHTKKAITIAIAGMCLPFLTALAFSLVIHKTTTMQQGPFTILFAISLSVTALPVLTRILQELRISDTEISQLSKTTALANDAIGLVFFVIANTWAESQTPVPTIIWVLLSSIGFLAFCILLVRPALLCLIKHTSDQESLSTTTTSTILSGFMFSCVISDAIGIHPVFGAFVFGAVVPNGPLATNLIDKFEDLVTGILLPLFYASCGLKINVYKIHGVTTWVALIAAIAIASVGKVVGTICASQLWKMPMREGAVLGFLLNSKGIFQLIALRIGKDQKVIDDTGYAIMMITVISMNAIITPVVKRIQKTIRRLVPYKRRTVQKMKEDSDLRVLACIHTPRNVPTIINLLELSKPNKRLPLSVFSLHLVEVAGHAAATLVDHKSRDSFDGQGMNKGQPQTEQIITAFETFGERNDVPVQSFTTLSPYSTMHEEVCNLAEDKQIAFVIVPFHKQQTVDGLMETTDPGFQMVNQNLLFNAPCSVGILVDRGLCKSSRLTVDHVSQKVAALFFGGPDDREALAYAVRMSEHPEITVNVIRFVPGPKVKNLDFIREQQEQGTLKFQIDQDKDKKLDDDCIKECRMMKANDPSFFYMEKVVNNTEETVSTIRLVEKMHDLFIVGKAEGIASPLTSGLSDWIECPELGLVGDLLASSDFSSSVSVLVVQQFAGLAPRDDWTGTPDRGSIDGIQYGHNP